MGHTDEATWGTSTNRCAPRRFRDRFVTSSGFLSWKSWRERVFHFPPLFFIAIVAAPAERSSHNDFVGIDLATMGKLDEIESRDEVSRKRVGVAVERSIIHHDARESEHIDTHIVG